MNKSQLISAYSLCQTAKKYEQMVRAIATHQYVTLTCNDDNVTLTDGAANRILEILKEEINQIDDYIASL